MPHSAIPEILDVLAEIFIALVGFSGVVIALGRSKIPEEAREFRIKALLFSGSVGLGGALLPGVLIEFTSDIWRFCAAALAIFMVINLIWALRRLVPMKRQGLAPPMTFWLVTIVTLSLICGLVVSVILPSILPPTSAYVAALAWHVYLAMNHFARLILAVRWESA